MFYLLSWLVALEMIGLIAFLNISKYYPNLADRGFSFSKPLAMITLAFMSWLLCIWGLANPNQLKEVRRQVARLMTIQTERKIIKEANG